MGAGLEDSVVSSETLRYCATKTERAAGIGGGTYWCVAGIAHVNLDSRSPNNFLGGGLQACVLRALAVRPFTTCPREDGVFFLQERSPMANRSLQFLSSGDTVQLL